MKLDLEELANEIIRAEYPTYEQTTIPQMKSSIIRKKEIIKHILKQHVKQVCEKTVTIVYGKTHICDGLVDWEIIGIFAEEENAKKWVKEKIKEWNCSREDIKISTVNLMDRR